MSHAELAGAMKGIYIVFLLSLVSSSDFCYCFSHNLYVFYTSFFFVSQSYFCAEANWELHVRIHSYIHLNSQTDWEGHHCDPIPSDPCENYFFFCLQPHGFRQTSNRCLHGLFDARNRIFTSSSATFSEGQNVFGPGIDNPLIFRGTANEAWIVSGWLQLVL